MTLTGGGNTTNHPKRDDLLKRINERLNKLKKYGEIPNYLKKDMSKMSWNELITYNSELQAELQLLIFGKGA